MWFNLAEILMGVLVLFVLLCVSLILYARWNYGALESMGVQVAVKPHWFLGSNYNYTEIYHHREEIKRVKEFGRVYGLYEGRTPIVFIADPETIYKILFTESDHFEKRAQDFGNEVFNENIEFQNGEKWKALHSALSPQFTSGKLKMQSGTILKVSGEYVEHLKSQMNSEGRVSKIDVHELLAPYAIQLIGEMLCGIKIENPRDPENIFVKTMRKNLFDGFKLDWTFNIMMVFPFVMKLFALLDKDGFKFLVDNVTAILDEREQSSNKIPDAVGALLEIRKKARTDPEYKRLGIGESSVFGQAFEFFAASFLGVTTTTKELFYFIATQPEIYKKIVQELDSVFQKFGEFSYDSLAEMEYLEACIMETLRIAPSFFRPERICTKDWSCNGINVKKGTCVAFPLYGISHNPEIFPEPETFSPERFLPENKEKLERCSYLPFGAGQRQCMGRRLAIPMIKIFTACILKDFMLEKREDTKWVENKGSNMVMMLDPIYLDFVKRKM